MRSGCLRRRMGHARGVAFAAVLLHLLGSPCACLGLGLGAKVRSSVRLVVSDLDGTLLCRNHTVGEGTRGAIDAMERRGVPLIVATGKSRQGALNSLEADLGRRLITGPSAMGGVFLQGLITYGPGGELLRELSLPKGIVAEVLAYAKEHNLCCIAYQRDELLCAEESDLTRVLGGYREPMPVGVGDLRAALLSSGATPTSKLLFIADAKTIAAKRARLEDILSGEAEVTQAIPEMLEVLPLGGNKGAGVAILLDHLGFDRREVMAMGDGENDLEMLQSVGLGVAMANAVPQLKAVASAVVERSNEEGGAAEAIRTFVL